MAYSRIPRKPIEVVFLPGDEELFGDYVRDENRRKYNVPHDHLAYSTRSKLEDDEAIIDRLKEMLARWKARENE